MKRIAFLLLCACTYERTLPSCPEALPTPAHPDAVNAMAVGDMADCATGDHEKVAAHVKAARPDVFLALGDLVYPNGSLREFMDCYDPTWGSLRPVTRPAIGNHEYHTERAGPYFAYFCSAAGHPKQGYYSFDIGTWHVVALNSNCARDLDIPSKATAEFGGCDEASPQALWLRDDLTRNRDKCTLAMWHHPKHNIGGHEDPNVMQALWRILVKGGADLALTGHAHRYERFEPEDEEGNRDPQGLVEMVVGTGGAPLSSDLPAKPNLAVQQNETFGALQLMLYPGRFTFRYVGIDTNFTDAGEGACRP